MGKGATLVASLTVLAQLFSPGVSLPAEYARDGALIGTRQTHTVGHDESLPEIARRYDIGFGAIVAANRGVDPFVPGPGREVVVPTQWILPDAPAGDGIVINTAEMRLFLFSDDGSRPVTTFPVGIGDQGRETPLGTYAIVEKIRRPVWHVPESIRRERPRLPAVVPPGPGNPLGSRALRLSNRAILIHGTNRPWGIGARNSHGCVRLYEEDIARLYRRVGLGTRVTIVAQPVKAAARGGRVYLQVQDHGNGRDLYREALKVLEAKRLVGRVDLASVRKAAGERSGLVADVSK